MDGVGGTFQSRKGGSAMGSRIVKAVGRTLKSVSSAVADVSSLTKGEMKMKKMIIGLMMVMMLAAGSAFAAPDNVAVQVTVIPGVSLTLTAGATCYNFKQVNLATSSGAVTSVAVENESNCAVDVAKEITANSGDWANASATAPDVYTLYVVALSTQPGFGATNGNLDALCKFADGTTPNSLTNDVGAAIELGADGQLTSGTTLWFAIDMPTTSGSSAAQYIDTKFTATAAN